MTPEDLETDPVEVWEVNWPVVLLFTRIGDQWRYGFSGPTGMDYSLAITLMNRMKLSDEAFDEMLDALQVMANAAREEMRKE